MRLQEYLNSQKSLPIFSVKIFLTLLKAELQMMFDFVGYTVIAPLVNTTLMILVFSLILPDGINYQVSGVPFLIFITPGLIMMNIAQNSFSQPAFGLVGRRMFKSLNALLTTPINGAEFVLAEISSGVVRGLLIGCLTFIACFPFVTDITIQHPLLMIFYLLASSMLMALLGLLCGIVSMSWEKLSIFTEYLLIPLSFLSGTFYAIDRLPVFFQKLTIFNPLFHMMDGLRYSFTGVHHALPLWVGASYIIVLDIVLFALSCYLFRIGYRLRN